MDTNIYALEVMAKSRLADLRAAAARRVLFESTRKPRRSVWAMLRSVLPWTGRTDGGRRIVSPRHA